MALLNCHFNSSALGMASSMDVILPEDPEEQPEAGWPCLFLLHGLSDDQTIWRRRTAIERYVAPYGLAVVMPNVHRSFYTDMVNGYPYWTYISEEIPMKARAFFPISKRREDTFVAGVSMGGYGAFKLALSFPERFAAAASLSGALDTRNLDAVAPARDYALVFGDGVDIAETPDDLFFLAEQIDSYIGPRPMLYACCGAEDNLYADTIAFRDHALELGLDLTYEEGPGIHEWAYWDTQIRRVLEWLPR